MDSGYSDMSAYQYRSQVAEIARLSTENAALKALSVTNIMIDVTPGHAGMGQEIYAKSVDDVVNLLSRLGEKAEDFDDLVRSQRKAHETITQQAAVIEQMPVAWLHQTRTSSDVITDEVKMFLLRQYERWEFHSSVQRPPVCKAENYAKPLYLHPAPAEVEALKLDAERYRWLRDDTIEIKDGQRGLNVVMGRLPFDEEDRDEDLFGLELDDAIDAAIKESK